MHADALDWSGEFAEGAGGFCVSVADVQVYATVSDLVSQTGGSRKDVRTCR